MERRKNKLNTRNNYDEQHALFWHDMYTLLHGRWIIRTLSTYMAQTVGGAIILCGRYLYHWRITDNDATSPLLPQIKLHERAENGNANNNALWPNLNRQCIALHQRALLVQDHRQGMEDHKQWCESPWWLNNHISITINTEYGERIKIALPPIDRYNYT